MLVLDEPGRHPSRGIKSRSERLTLVHGAQHAGGKLVDGIALLHQRDQRRDPALVVRRWAEVGKDQLLELIDLVLKVHQVCNGLISTSSESVAVVNISSVRSCLSMQCELANGTYPSLGSSMPFNEMYSL